jgi:hypothetical protein
LSVGIEAAWQDIRFDAQRFDERGGHYDWRPPVVPLAPIRLVR